MGQLVVHQFLTQNSNQSFIDMINIFEVFLPQLLRYPNPNDPLNGEAAALLMRHPKEYEVKVKGRFRQNVGQSFGIFLFIFC